MECGHRNGNCDTFWSHRLGDILIVLSVQQNDYIRIKVSKKVDLVKQKKLKIPKEFSISFASLKPLIFLRDNTIKIWDSEKGIELGHLIGHTKTILGAEFSPDVRWIASASEDWTVRVWDASTYKECRVLR